MAARTIELLAVILICQSLPLASSAQQFAVIPLQEMALDTEGLVLATGGNFSNLINGSPYQQEVLLSHDGYQYAVWYHNGSDQDIRIGRRDLTGTTWEVIDTGRNMEIGNQDWNSHNIISMGISSDGRIHLAFDHHVDPLRYLTTNAGVATSSGGTWNSSIFNTERSSLNPGGSNIPRITYPRFTNVGDDMVFTYRDFGSGSGDQRIAEYDPQTGLWSGTRFMTRGRGTGQTYDDANNNPSNNRNSYHNGFHADPFGRLHTTWTWREGTQDGNHGIMYAYSDDKGITWLNTNDQLVGTNASPITLNSPGVEIFDLDRRHGILNQQGGVVDAEGGVHALMFHRPVGHPFTNSPFSDASNSDYHHYYRNPATGIWEVNVFPNGIAVGNRPRLGVDSSGNLYGLYVQSRDLVIAGAQKIDGEYEDWEILYRDNSRDYAGTPQLDLKRLFDDGILSIYLQDRATNTSANNPTGSTLRVLEFVTIIPTPPEGTLMAGWDTWDGSGVHSANVTDGMTVGTTSAVGFAVDSNQRASTDGTWGTLDTPAADATADDNGDTVRLTNGSSGHYDFTLMDTGGADRNLLTFHFDSATFRPNSARNYELSVLSGDLMVGTVATGTVPSIAGGQQDWSDFDIPLTGLADHTLDANGSVTFRLEFTGGEPGAGGHHQSLDNVAVTAELPSNLIASGAPDGSLRYHKGTGVVDGQDIGFVLNSEELNVGQSGTAPFDRAAVMVFQLPDLGAIEDPFQAASFQAYLTQTITSGNIGGDLYGIARRDAPEILNSDYYGRTNTPDPGAVLLEDDFLAENMAIDAAALTSPTGSENLLDFLNEQYAGGDGIGDYIFLRLNADAETSQRWSIASGDASIEDQKPQIQYQAIGGPQFLLGDFDNNGNVDLADLDRYNGSIGVEATGDLEALDLNNDGTVGADDFATHYGTLVETSNGQKGTFPGDLNLDGTVDVLGDAFALVSNLGNNSATSWAQGDIDGNGVVDVLGDAFALVANLGQSNE